jgi:general secretion pathway protein J
MNNAMKQSTRVKANGFTLLEILIALAIFAVIAVIVVVGLRTVINTNQRVNEVDDRLRQILMATTIMRRDISQMIDRPITDSSGSKVGSLYIPNTSTFQFTRAGYTNPMGMLNRSSLQRVEYTLKNHKIIRTVWSTLDRTSDTKKQAVVLLTGVKSLYLSYVDPTGKVIDSWSTKIKQNEIFPRAISMEIKLKKMGQLTLIIPIIGRGYAM